MPSPTRRDWLKKQIRYRHVRDVVRTLRAVVGNWLMELEACGGPAKRDKNSAVSLLRTSLQTQQLQSQTQLTLWPGREAPERHASDCVREEAGAESEPGAGIPFISEHLKQITLRWSEGKWFLHAPMIEGFEKERQITVRRLVALIADLEDEWAANETAKAEKVRARLQRDLDGGWAVLHITRRGTKIWGRPVLTRDTAEDAVYAMLYAVETGTLAYEDVLRGDYIVAPFNWLDWSKGMDPETTAEIIDWLAMLRMERRRLAGVAPEEVDRLAQAAIESVKQQNPDTLINETRTIGGALWQR